MGGRARHSVRAAIGIQPPELSTIVAIQILALKKQIMQVPVFTTGYARRQRLPFIRPRRPWLPSPPLRGGWRNPAPPIFGVCCGWSFGNGRAPPERLLDVVRVQAAGVAERHWILASYEVAGRVPKEVVRPGGTPEFRRPVRTDSVLQPTPGTWEGLRVRGGHIQSRLPSVSSCISPLRGPG